MDKYLCETVFQIELEASSEEDASKQFEEILDRLGAELVEMGHTEVGTFHGTDIEPSL